MKIELSVHYVVTPPTNYSFDLFDDWWPSKWKGGAWICPNKHQIPREKYDYGFYGGNEHGIFCPGCNRWVSRKLMKWDPVEKKCTMGYARRKSEFEEEEDNERNINTISTRNQVPARRATRKQRSPGYTPGESMDSRKTRRRKSNDSLGSEK